MLKTTKDVLEFHDVFDLAIAKKGEVPSKQVLQLRFNLMFEELMEYAEAADIELSAYLKLKEKLTELENKPQGDKPVFQEGANVDHVGVLDALADLEYVLQGTVISHGLHHIFEEGFSEVHRSNMTKTCDDMEVVNQTIGFYKGNKGEIGHPVEKELNGKKVYIVKREGDGKVLKAIDYESADLTKIYENGL